MDVFFTLDLLGTAVFAYTGSVAAKEQRFHVLGVFYISFLTAVGGGTVRSVLLQTPDLFWMKSSAYFMVIGGVIAASYVIRINTNRLWFYVLDSLSIAIFVALGVSVTLQHGQPLHIAFAMGVLTGIGGGLIRDAITSRPPQALSDPAYPVIMAAAAIGSIVSINFGLETWTLACLAVSIVVLLNFTINYFRTGKFVKYQRTRSETDQLQDKHTDTRSTRRGHATQADNAYARHDRPSQSSRLPNHAESAKSSPVTPARHQMQPTGQTSKSGIRTLVHASAVIFLAGVATFHYLARSIPDATANVTASLAPPAAPPSDLSGHASADATAALRTTDIADGKQEYLALLQSIEDSLSGRQIALAEQLLSDAGRTSFSDHKLESLVIKTNNLKAYLTALDAADIALAGNDTTVLQEKLALASSLGYNDHRLATLKASLANSLELSKINTANKILARKSFELHLSSAEHQLGLGHTDLATAEIEAAKSFRIKSTKLARLEQQIAAEIAFDSTPLTDEEFEYAANRFRQLERAIKLQNINAISTLTSDNDQKRRLFSGLFDRYVEINASVSQLSTKADAKVISAKLELENMRLPNGNLAYPASSYGEITLSLQRTRQGWSRINW